MKNLFLASIFIFTGPVIFAQWTDNGSKLTTSDQVGIGTTNPQRELHITSSGWSEIRLDGTNGGTLEFYNATNKSADIYSDNAGKNLIFRTNGSSEAMRILSSGNVGIGNDAPSFKLTVDGEIGIIKNYPYLQFNSTSWNSSSFIQTGVTTAAQANGDYMVFRNPANKGFNFRQGTYNALTVQPSGNVGIGTNGLSFKLSVEGEVGIIKDYPYLQFNSTSWNSNSFIQTGVTTAAQANGDYMVFRNPDNKGFNFRQGSSNAMTIAPSGDIGIGTVDPKSKLAVEGQIRATEVKVMADISVPDYVFEPDYDLRTLQETKEYIAKNKHLPEIPSAAEIGENGIDLGDMNMRLLKKIEELTLYLLEQDKVNKDQQKTIQQLQEEVAMLKKK